MVAEVHFEAGYVPRDQDVDMFAQALRAIGEPIRDQRAQEISMSKLLTQLFEVTELFEMRTQPQLLLLQKTMVVVEGVARSLDPGFDMWGTAEPIVRSWIEEHLGPVGHLRNAAEGLGAIARLMADVPDLAARVGRISENLDRMTAEGLDLSKPTIREIEMAVSRRSSLRLIALWIAAIAVTVIAIQNIF
jgi:ubiquinone biosynthesis protein